MSWSPKSRLMISMRASNPWCFFAKSFKKASLCVLNVLGHRVSSSMLAPGEVVMCMPERGSASVAPARYRGSSASLMPVLCLDTYRLTVTVPWIKSQTLHIDVTTCPRIGHSAILGCRITQQRRGLTQALATS